MKRALPALVMAACLTAGAVRAEPDEQAQRLAVAREIVSLNGIAVVYAKMFDAMRYRLEWLILDSAAQTSGLPREQVQAVFARFYLPGLEAHAGDFADAHAAAYAQALSLEDLKQIRDFYHTPAGQHLGAAVPGVTSQVAAFQETWQIRVVKELVARNADLLRQSGLKP